MGGFCNEVRCIMKKENNSAHNHNRGSFSGRIGYVLAVAGSAVGLGNIWRFPYLAAKYGGGIFLLIYILLTASFGYVLIMSETALGRMTRKSPVGAFEHFGKTKSFKIGGWLNAGNHRKSCSCFSHCFRIFGCGCDRFFTDYMFSGF